MVCFMVPASNSFKELLHENNQFLRDIGLKKN
jgi:hypothetical protein